MSDMYREIMIQKKTPMIKKLLKGMLPVLTVLFLFAGMVMPLLLIGAVAFGLATFFLAPKLEVEYEYLYVNGELDIDAIYSRQKRKKVGSYDVAELEILAPSNSHALDSYLNGKNASVKDYTSGDPQVKSYILIYNKDKGQEMIKVELDDVILNDMRRMAPRKVNLM